MSPRYSTRVQPNSRPGSNENAARGSCPAQSRHVRVILRAIPIYTAMEMLSLIFLFCRPMHVGPDHLMRIKLSSGEGRGSIGHAVRRLNEAKRISRRGTHLSAKRWEGI